MSLEHIETIVIVILENRSFDHMVGYLSLASANPPMPVAGLRDDAAWRRQYNNLFAGKSYPIKPLDSQVQQIVDPPHEMTDIGTQIDTAPQSGPPDQPTKMGGFVKSYNNAKPKPPADEYGRVMGYYGKDAVPAFDFFARNFAICDQWFSSLPCGTQPNRLMAMAGESEIAVNVNSPFQFPDQKLVYDWLSGNNIKWCSYQWGGFPFFALMPRWWPEMASLNDPFGFGLFRYYDRFLPQWVQDNTPPVIFIEPKYTDAPGFSRSNDDHPPTGIAKGQQLVADIYNTLIRNPKRWANTMMIVTYDEHGGFFDHAAPLPVPGTGGDQKFSTTGVRVPAFVVSPQVKAGGVFSKPLDHTSILQLLADRFTKGTDYSAAVADRQKHFAPLATVLEPVPPVQPRVPTIPTDTLKNLHAEAAVASVSLDRIEPQVMTPTAQAFHTVALELAKQHPEIFTEPGSSAMAEYLAVASRDSTEALTLASFVPPRQPRRKRKPAKRRSRPRRR